MSKTTTLRLTFPTLAKRFKFWLRASIMLFTGKIRIDFVASAFRNYGDSGFHKTGLDTTSSGMPTFKEMAEALNLLRGFK